MTAAEFSFGPYRDAHEETGGVVHLAHGLAIALHNLCLESEAIDHQALGARPIMPLIDVIIEKLDLISILHSYEYDAWCSDRQGFKNA